MTLFAKTLLATLSIMLMIQHPQPALAAGSRAQVKVIKRNARRGRKRERWATFWTRVRYLGATVQRERTIVDRKGNKALDKKTGQGRRFDIAVISNFPFRRVKKLIEVTSKTASKTQQEAKTARILSRYRKLFIRDRDTRELLPIRRGLFFRTRFETQRR